MSEIAGLLSYSFVTSPLLLVVIAMMGLCIALRWKRAGLSVAFLALIAFYLLSLPFVAGSLLAMIERGVAYDATGEAAAGAIVVLGGDIERLGRSDETPRLGPLSLERVYFAAIEYRALKLPVLVTGGAIDGAKIPIADLMAEALRNAFDVPVRWRETRARTTYENAAYSAVILKQAGIATAVIVTQSWHMRRAIWAFSRVGIHAFPMRLPKTGLASPDRTADFKFSDFLPSANAILDSFYAMHEILGLAYYRLAHARS